MKVVLAFRTRAGFSRDL
jgi:hypothetical protein